MTSVPPKFSLRRSRGSAYLLFVCCLVFVTCSTVGAKPDPDCRHAPGSVSKLRERFEDACLEKNEVVALQLIEQGLLIQETDEDKTTPLFLAVRAPMPKVAKRLIELGASVQAETNAHDSILFSAVDGRSTATVLLVIQSGADVNEVNDQGYSALMEAARLGLGDIVRILLEGGANPALARKDGTDALALAASNGHAEIVRLLAKLGGKVNAVDADGNTPLLMACLRGNLPTVEVLVECGADINAAGKNRYAMTPLTMVACRKPTDKSQDYTGILRYLLSQGAKTNIPDGNGSTALALAARTEQLENIRVLAGAGVDFHSPNGDVITAFLEAVRRGRHRTVAAFLDLGLNPDSCRPTSRTEPPPIFYAVEVNHDEKMVKLLLDGGADASATRRYKPIHLGGFLGAPPDLGEIEESVLIAAVRSGHPAIVKLLLTAGAKTDYRDSAGMSALERAKQTGNKEILRLLTNKA